MQLTLYTDYSLRVLVFLNLNKELVTISQIADYFKISRNHLVKVVHQLASAGYVQSTRGKSGGLRLAKPAQEISIGEIVRFSESNLQLIDCYDEQKGECTVAPICKLKGVLNRALDAFLAVLDGVTIADVLDEERLHEFLPLTLTPPK